MSDLTKIFGGVPFDPQSVEPAKEWEPVPPGLHPVLIRRAFMKRTKAGTGSYLQVEMDIVDGPAKGHKLVDRLNLDNPSEKAARIAAGTLSAICHSTGLVALSTEEQLINLTTIALVKIDKENQNDITTYLNQQQAAEYTAKKAGTPTIVGPPPATRVTPVQQVAPVQPPVQQVVQPSIQQQPVQQVVQPLVQPIQQPVQQSVQQPLVQPVVQPVVQQQPVQQAAAVYGIPPATPGIQTGPPVAGDNQQLAPAGQPIWLQGK